MHRDLPVDPYHSNFRDSVLVLLLVGGSLLFQALFYYSNGTRKLCQSDFGHVHEIGGQDPQKWHIDCTALVGDIENPILVIAAPAMAVASSYSPAVAKGENAPKKYVKDPKGKMTLNPEFRDWKNAQ